MTLDRPRVKAPMPDSVADAFAAYGPAVRAELLTLRALILDTAAQTPGVGAIEESLRWGQPAYRTNESGSGSTLRVAPTGPALPHGYAMYVICRTALIGQFRSLFGDRLVYQGTRAVVFDVREPRPDEAVRECIAAGLTYHARMR